MKNIVVSHVSNDQLEGPGSTVRCMSVCSSENLSLVSFKCQLICLSGKQAV